MRVVSSLDAVVVTILNWNFQITSSVSCWSLHETLQRHEMNTVSSSPRYCCLVTKLYQLFCNTLDCSLPAPLSAEIFQAKILQWVAISFSRESSWPRDRTHICLVDKFYTTWEALFSMWAKWINITHVLKELMVIMKTRPMKACLVQEQWYRLFLSSRSQRSSQYRELSGKADWEDRTLARS